MPTVSTNKKLLDMKRWEICSPAPTTTQAGSHIISSHCHKQIQLYIRSNTEHYIYDPFEDGWIQIPSGALNVVAGCAGTCLMSGGIIYAASYSTQSYIFRSAGFNMNRDLTGYKVFCLSGVNAGQERTIKQMFVSGVGIIGFEVDTPFTSAPNSMDEYRVHYPKFVVASGGSNSVKVYDYAMNSWSTFTNLPFTSGTDLRLVATPSIVNGERKIFFSGTATGGTTATVVDSTQSWLTNQFAGRQVRITSGTSAGRSASIVSNDSTTLTLAGFGFSTPTDATSTYVIEGSDDYFYVLNGNNTNTLHRYSITSTTYTALASRGGNAGAGITGHWVQSSGNSVIDGDRIYSFRGGNTTTLDYYTISSNTWTNAITYWPATPTISTGTKSILRGQYIYLCLNGGNFWYRFDILSNTLDPLGYMYVAQGTAVVGDTAFDATYKDGATELRYLYMLLNSSGLMYRMMLI